MSDFSLSFAPSMTAIDRTEWDALASRYDCPFLSWGFLALLEESGSIVPEKGWTPLHLCLRRGGKLVAAAPLYGKTSSWGEFVFDFEFARVAEANGIAWYPKLVGMVPATPSPAWRVLVAEGEDEAALTALIIDAAIETARSNDFGGFHILWPARETQDFLRARNQTAATGKPRATAGSAADIAAQRLIPWEHQSFLWTDEGYGDFEGYLATFSKNMRRNVRREREGLDSAGVTRRMIEAEEAAATPGLLARMADFYESTNDKFGPWAARWLERDFFLRLPEFMPSGWVLGAAFDGSTDAAGNKEPLALSFMLRGGGGLWGRYWGTSRFEAGLHFELCYYLPIAWALQKDISFFDPGMGSEHKARRGFRSVLVPSFHLVFDRRLAQAMERSLAAANVHETEGARMLDRELPFKKDPDAGGGPAD